MPAITEAGGEETRGAAREPPSRSQQSHPPQKEKKKRAYVPKKGSGSYALLIALAMAERDDGREELNKQELVQLAQPYAEESMSKARLGSHYTAFNSIKTLVSNELVKQHQSRNAFYSLTEEGRQLARKLVSYAEEKGVAASSQDSCREDYSCRAPERQVLMPGTFEVVLLVDTREQSSGAEQGLKKTAIMSELLKHGVAAEMRALPVGDFAWIARRKPSDAGRSPLSPELVLDIVIERKRADDLASSIVDGRFREQKHRLLRSGVRKPMYLVEGLVRADYSVPYRSLLQAVTSAQVIDGFLVKTTLNHSETIAFLSVVTKQLSSRVAGKTLLSCTHRETQERDARLPDNSFLSFQEFERGSRKISNFTVTEMLLKHLIQFAGMTVVKAKAVTARYRTLKELLQAYEECGNEKERTKLLASVKYGNMSRSVGPVLSNRLFQYYTHTPRLLTHAD